MTDLATERAAVSPRLPAGLCSGVGKDVTRCPVRGHFAVRARNAFSNRGAQLRTLAGGEVAGYTRLLTDSRNQARERMWREARARGANAIVAMRFDCNEIGDIMSEVAAYGTAVTAEPIQPPLPRTTLDGGRAGQGRHGQAPSLTGDGAGTTP